MRFTKLLPRFALCAFIALAAVTNCEASILSFSQTAYGVNEGAGNAVITVTLNRSDDPDPGATVMVDYKTLSGSANGGPATDPSRDYTSQEGTLTFAPGETSKNILVPINDDALIEPTEDFSIIIFNPSASPSPRYKTPTFTNSSATVSIFDNDQGNTIQFNPSVYTANEAGPDGAPGQVVLTVTANRTGDPNVVLTVNYATRDGSAVVGQDYQFASGTVTFNAGETQKQISVQLINDNLIEQGENFFVDLTNPQNATFSAAGVTTATVNVVDDDGGTSTLQFSSSTYSADESGGSAILTVVRSGGIGFTGSANYATSDGTAKAGSDYSATTSTVTFAPGEYSKNITVPILQDAISEGTETFTVSLSSPSANAALGTPAVATVSINDDDAGSTIQFTPAVYTTSEADPNGQPGQAVLTVVANRTGDPNATVTVDYSTRNGTAAAGQDYAFRSGTVVFNAGETQKQIMVSLINDTLIESTENFFVDLTNPQNASFQGSGSPTATVNIVDDDGGTSTIQFSAAQYSVGEAGGSAVLTVTRMGGIGFTVSANYSTSDGTATAGSDYTGTISTVTFAPGEYSKNIAIPITNDSVAESTESFSVSLSNPSNNAALGGQAMASVAISDDDAGGNSLQFSPATYTVSEASGTGQAGQALLTVTANRTGDPNTMLTVDYATRNGSAIAGQDYNFASGTIVFNPGETQKQISVQLINDNLIESPENFFVDLTNPINASLSAPSSATVNVADDDGGTSTIQFSASEYSVSEGDGSAVITVTRSGGASSAVSANYTTANGTAVAGSDYGATSSTVTFAPGEYSKNITIPIINDSVSEPTESFSVALSNPSNNATLGVQANTTVTISDNDANDNSLQFNPAIYTVGEASGTGQAGQAILTVTANRSGNPNAILTVDYATRNGSAVAGQDYTSASGTIVFNAGETQKQVSVQLINDNLIEATENFFVDLTNPANASLSGANTATVNIADDDGGTSTIQFNTSEYSVSEGGGSAVLTVTRSGGVGFAVSANYNTANGTATAGSDYTATASTVMFAPGEYSKNIGIPITQDAVSEPAETFTVSLTNPGPNAALGSPSTVTVNIFDDEPAPVITSPTTATAQRDQLFSYQITATNTPKSFGASGLPPGLTIDASTGLISGTPTSSGTFFVGLTATNFAGTGSATLTLTVNPPPPVITSPTSASGQQNVFFSYQITATNNPTSYGTSGLPPGLSVNTSSGLISGTPTVSGTFNVTISATNGGGTGTANLRITLASAGTTLVQFQQDTYTANSSQGSITLTVDLSRAVGDTGSFSVDYATNDGSAVAGRDYESKLGTLVFGNGQTTETITVPLLAQATPGPNRSFTVMLSNPARGAIGRGTATVIISTPDNSTKLLNISTRGPVESGNDVMIAGFIIQGTSSKQLVLRGIGPSLTAFGVPGAISDPTLTLVDSNGAQIAYDDDYTSNSSADQQVLMDNGLTLTNSHESALVVTIPPGAYTAILRGKTNGVGLVEAYDISGTASSRFANISTRCKVEQGDNGALIAGFIIASPPNQPGTAQQVVIRAIGPSLKNYGISGALADTTLDIYRGSQLILSNDNWKTNTAQDQQALQSNGLAPTNDKEAAIITNLDPGSYSAVVRGKNNTTGVALVEVYNLNQ
jgi:hypothetical protein